MTQTREALIALAEKLSVLKGRIHAELSGIELQTMTQAIDALASVREWQPLHDLRMEMETHLHLALEEEQRGNTRPDASEVLKIYLGRIAQMLPDPPKETRNQYPFACGNCPPCVAGRWWTCETPKTEETPEAPSSPKVICLCGSTRFIEQFAIATWELERGEGAIVLGCTLLPIWYCGVASHFGEATGTKEECDEHHRRKIDLADEVLVLDIGGYIGESTQGEIQYAARAGKPVRYVSHEPKLSAKILPSVEAAGLASRTQEGQG